MTVTLDRPMTTQAPDPTVCPDALPWCVDHEVDEDGYHYHRTTPTDIRADRLGFRSPHDLAVFDTHAVLVNNEDGTPDPVVWLSQKFPLPPRVYMEDGVGFSPTRAREVGLLLVQLGADLEGAVVTPVPRYTPGAHPCQKGVPWCNDEQAAGDENHSTCWSGEQYLPATGGRLPDGRDGGGTKFVSALLEQTRDEEPTIALNVAYAIGDLGLSDAAQMTLDEAEQFALYLLDRVAMLRGGEVR